MRRVWPLVLTLGQLESEGVLTFDGEEFFPEGDPRTVSVVVEFAIECTPPAHPPAGSAT